VTPSPHRPKEIWASTDDGLVHVTRDDGKRWTDVTPPGMPKLAYVGCVEISAHDPDTVYVSATRYKLADYRPYLFRSTHGGKRWESITGDLPKDEITRVIRADPQRPGLLFVGTETGVFFTLDDGRHWTRMHGLAVAPVYDIKIKHDDLIVATHGRSFWVLDDISPLRQLSDDTQKAQLVRPRDTVRVRLSWSAGSGYGKAGISYGPAFGIGGGSGAVTLADGSSTRVFLDVGEGRPQGAIVYYWLPKGHKGAVRLSFTDARGRPVRSVASDDTKVPAGKRPGTRPGLNRYVWDLKHQGPNRLDPALMERKNAPFAAEAEELAGPTVTPGTYTVQLDAGGTTLSAPFAVVKDPRVKASQRAFDQQFTLLQALHDKWSQLNDAINRIRLLKRQLRELAKRAGMTAELARRAQALGNSLQAIEAALVCVPRESPRDVLRFAAGLDDTLVDCISVVAIADEAPTTQARQVSDETMARVDALLQKLDALLVGDMPAFNALLARAAVQPLGLAA
jgi:hypothetical protein